VDACNCGLARFEQVYADLVDGQPQQEEWGAES
jgi:hypothetical protein